MAIMQLIKVQTIRLPQLLLIDFMKVSGKFPRMAVIGLSELFIGLIFSFLMYYLNLETILMARKTP